MKKLIVASLLALSLSAHAQHWHHGHHGHHHYGSGGWVAPLIIGGVVGAVIARESQHVVVQQPPVVVQQPQTVYQAPYGYHYENILDANCNCYRTVLVQNR